MHTLYALDLTDIPGADYLWRRGQRLVAGAAVNRPGIPGSGFASPLGFWFAAAESWGTVIPPLRVEIFDRDKEDKWDELGLGTSSGLARAQHSCRVQFRRMAVQARPAGSSTPLLLEIDATTARIGIDPDSWSSVSETVLIVIAQFWRFLAIGRFLDELTDWARRDLKKDGFIDLIRRCCSRELRVHQRELQSLILDLPDFELLLTDPHAGLSPGRPVRLYRALAGRVGLSHHRRAIDERVEVVEAVLDSLADSRNHLQALAIQIVLELAIVTVLLLDVGLYLWDWLGW